MKNINQNIYQIVTDRIVASLESGTVPWQKTWNYERAIPQNLSTKKAYRGCNVLLLWMCSDDSYFLTFNQAKSLGARIRKGASSLPVVYWNWIETESEGSSGVEKSNDKSTRIPYVKYFRVFGISDIEDLPQEYLPVTGEKKEPTLDCKELLEKHNPKILPGNPAYAPISDVIFMPEFEAFESEIEGSYFATLLHELAHWTGNASRLNREMCTNKNAEGIEAYSIEELIAELSASYLCSYFGIENPALNKNQEAYISNWLNKIKGDSHLVIQAATKAQQVVNYLLGNQHEENETTEETNE